jgi:hypothetical protein
MVCPIALEKIRRKKLIMKWKLLLCGAIFVVAGCSSPENPFVSSGEAPYTYDYVPQPVPDISPIDLDILYHLPPTGSADSSTTAVK